MTHSDTLATPKVTVGRGFNAADTKLNRWQRNLYGCGISHEKGEVNDVDGGIPLTSKTDALGVPLREQGAEV